MLLDTTTRKIQVKLGEAITTSNCDVVAAFVDMSAPGYTPGSANTVTNGTTAVDAVAVPGSGQQRQVNMLSVYNADTVTHFIIVIYNDNGTLRTEIKASVLAGQTLQWVKDTGWSIVPTTASATLPTRQVFTSGTAATYTTPTGCRQIRIRFKAGGGGGGASGSTAPTAATAGGDTTFNSIVAKGGGLGTTGSTGGLGGTGGTGSASTRFAGETGGTASSVLLSATLNAFYGGVGAGSGGGIPVYNGNGGAAAANCGSGGAGAGQQAAALASIFGYIGGGGGEGEMAELIINNPAASYLYTVGPGGTGGVHGTSGQDGGNGSAGIIIVDEYY